MTKNGRPRPTTAVAPPGDRPVFITGCSSGIGLCVARGLRARGYRVFATARKPDDVARLSDAGFEALHLNLAEPESIRSSVATVRERTGDRLYALFNNGAYAQPGAVEDLTRAALREQFETNLFGTVELTNRVIPLMRARGEGRIIQNSSVLGLVAMPFRGAYNATKFALEGISDTLRLELAGSGIHVSLIEPGPITSRFRENAYAAYRRHIHPTDSAHREAYQALERRLTAKGPVAPFTLPPEAVLAKVIRALESRRPKPRYYVTVPTHAFGILRRVLTDRALDRILMRASGGGQR